MHEHKTCKHTLKFCEQCDAVYCEKCQTEWTRGIKVSTGTDLGSWPPPTLSHNPAGTSVCTHAIGINVS